MNQGYSTLQLYQTLPPDRILAHRKNLAGELEPRVKDTTALLNAAAAIEVTEDVNEGVRLWVAAIHTSILTSPPPKVPNKRGWYCKGMNVAEWIELMTDFVSELERLKFFHFLFIRFATPDERWMNLVMVAGLLFENVLLHFLGGQCTLQISITFIQDVQRLYLTDAHETAAEFVPTHPSKPSAQTEQFRAAITQRLCPHLKHNKAMRTLAQQEDKFHRLCNNATKVQQQADSICDTSALAPHLQEFYPQWYRVFSPNTDDSLSSIIRKHGNNWQTRPGLLVKASPMGPSAGDGVFGNRDFEAGEFLDFYHGLHALASSDQQLRHAYADIGNGPVNWKIFGRRYPNGHNEPAVISTIAKVNNVCGDEFSNVELIKEYTMVDGRPILVLYMRTTKKVKKGVEFRYEYMRAHRNNNPSGSLPGCVCGSVECRGRSFPS